VFQFNVAAEITEATDKKLHFSCLVLSVCSMVDVN